MISISKLNVGHISETLNNSIRSWLESLITSQQGSTIEELEKVLINYVQQSMINPLLSCNKQLLDGLNKIPLETSDKIMSSDEKSKLHE